jgi:hypothetical protein
LAVLTIIYASLTNEKLATAYYSTHMLLLPSIQTAETVVPANLRTIPDFRRLRVQLKRNNPTTSAAVPIATVIMAIIATVDSVLLGESMVR